MGDFFLKLFNTAGFPARWTCGDAWSEEVGVGWLHIIADLATFVAYYAVPCVVVYFVARHKNVKFPREFYVFLGLIFFSCGTVHLVEAGLFYWPVYRLSGLLKAVTAMVSLSGVFLLVRILPRALELKSGEAYEREVTSRKEAEASLEWERNLLHTMMTSLPDPIFFKDKEGRFLRVSAELARKLCLDDVSQAVGKSDADFFDAEHAARSRQEEEQVMASGEPVVGLVEKETWPDGRVSWVSTTRAPLVNREGELLGTFGVSRDITPIKLAEQQLAEVAARLSLPRRSAPEHRTPVRLEDFSLRNMIECGIDIRGMSQTVNHQHDFADRLVNYLHGRIVDERGEPAFALLRVFVTCPFGELDDELRGVAEELGGHELSADTKCLVLLSTTGDQPAWRDVRQSRGHRAIPLPGVEAVAELPMIAQLIRQLGLDVGGLLEGNESILVDQSATGVFHVQHAEGSPFIPAQDEFVVPHGIRSVVGFGDLLPSGQLFAVIGFSRVEISLDTATLFAHLSLSTKLGLLPFEEEASRVEAQIVCVDRLLRNHEEVVCGQEGMLREAMSELKAARDAADAANRAKSDFLANMSHEIRTPMNAVLGMTELVLETELTASQRDYLRTVLESGESLLSIINEILDFSKIEAGRVELESVPFDLREEVGDTMKSLAIRAHRKELELAWHVMTDVPNVIVGDSARLRQILVNLSGNAIKFTDAGEVVLHVSVERSSGDEATLHFALRDTGVGIPTEKQDAVFDEFEQADTSTTRQFGGTGLGLAITSRLVSLMGGRIWVESEPGVGSTFHFTLPYGIGGDALPFPPPGRPEILDGMRVLIVDDNPTNRRILQETVASWGMQPTTAESAAEALQALEQFKGTEQTGMLVLTDINMPVMDGFMMAEEIRKSPDFKDTVIIALTSGGRIGDSKECQRLGIAAELLKPVKQSELFDAILAATATATDLAPSETEHKLVDADELPRLRILLAEDGLANQKLAIGLLERWGHEVSIASNGLQAVEAWEQGSFQLILMDVQMPEMDGLEATRTIRQRESELGGRIPIIAMTAHALKGDRERCLESGMDGYVSKPIRKQTLEEAIRSSLHPDAGDPPPSAEPSNVPRSESIDWQAALEAVGGEEALLAEFTQVAAGELTALAAELPEALAAGDAERVQRVAHTMKGTVRLFNVAAIEELANKIELLAESGTLEEIQPVQLALTERLNAFIVELKAYVTRHQ